MSVVLTINNQNFDYPQTGDEEWGPDATDWAVAVSSGLLQKTGGLFQLLAEVDFGPTYGLKSVYFKSGTANPATTGTLRLAESDGIYWRNNANSANLGLTLDNTDNLLFNGNPFGGVLGVADTDSIDMSLIGGNVSGDLNLSADAADAGSILVNHTIEADGLKGQWLLSDVPIADTNTTGFLSDTDWDTFNAKQAAGDYITALTGDVTATGPGSVAATLATVNADVGSFINSNITVNGKGLITAASSGIRVLNQSFDLGNLGLSASVGSNLLTVALKQSDGTTDPASGTGTVRIGFRSATLTTGGFTPRTVTGALSINTVATGASFGTINNQNQFIYIYAIDNAGTVELALAGNMIFDEGILYSTTAIGAGSNSNQVLYSTTARANVAIRLIGRLLNNQTTAGTYANAPTQLSLIPFNDANLRSEVWLTGQNGYGSTNTKIRRFLNTAKNYGTAITYADSATNGASFTINEAGIYAVSFTDIFSGGSYVGISLNSTQLTTNIQNITPADQLAVQDTANTNKGAEATAIFVGNVGDVVRAHTEGSSTGVGVTPMFRITKIGN